MFHRRLVGLLLGASVMASFADAQEGRQPTYEITYGRAIELARRQSPGLISARARVAEAQGGTEAASVWPFNPQLEASAGPRFQGAGETADWSAGGRQWFELGGQAGRRIAIAQAGLAAARARSENDERMHLRDVGLAFVQALSCEQRLALAGENLGIAEEISRIAQRRHEVGDAGGLEESVASLSLHRAQADEARARAALGQAIGRLKILLGLEPEAQILTRGHLHDLATTAATTPPDLDARPDVRALAAEVQKAESEAGLARAARVPSVALGASYSREESADIVLGAVTVTLPVFDYGQGAEVVARTRQARIRTQLEATRHRVVIEANTAAATSRELSAALRQFEAGGLATLERAEHVAAASYEAGAIPLGELLAVRAEVVRAKVDYEDLLLGAATARVEMAAATGVWE